MSLWLTQGNEVKGQEKKRLLHPPPPPITQPRLPLLASLETQTDAQFRSAFPFSFVYASYFPINFDLVYYFCLNVLLLIRDHNYNMSVYWSAGAV